MYQEGEEEMAQVFGSAGKIAFAMGHLGFQGYAFSHRSPYPSFRFCCLLIPNENFLLKSGQFLLLFCCGHYVGFDHKF